MKKIRTTTTDDAPATVPAVVLPETQRISEIAARQPGTGYTSDPPPSCQQGGALKKALTATMDGESTAPVVTPRADWSDWSADRERDIETFKAIRQRVRKLNQRKRAR